MNDSIIVTIGVEYRGMPDDYVWPDHNLAIKCLLMLKILYKEKGINEWGIKVKNIARDYGERHGYIKLIFTKVSLESMNISLKQLAQDYLDLLQNFTSSDMPIQFQIRDGEQIIKKNRTGCFDGYIIHEEVL